MSANSLQSSQVFGDRISLTGAAGDTLTYRYGNLPKACVHPLVTPAGHRLSGFEMSDHVWHRGLWFTIKFINGSNFWEEHAPYGVQVATREPAVTLTSPDSAVVSHEIEWRSEATGVVLRELRSLIYRTLPGGIGAIDWSAKLEATQDLKLDRTPYTTWGGYGGLSFRSSRELHKAALLTSTGEITQGLAGAPGDWVVMQGLIDGGLDQKVAIGIVDHPSNPRTPSPWYAKVGPEVNYMNAAFLFHEPMDLPRGQSLSFNYRVLYRDGHWTAEEFGSLADAFRETPRGAR